LLVNGANSSKNGRKSQLSNSSDFKCYQLAAWVNKRQLLELGQLNQGTIALYGHGE